MMSQRFIFGPGLPNVRAMCRGALAALAFLFAGGIVASAEELDLSKLPPPAQREVDFVKDIQPILAKNCYSCHGPQRQKGEFRWDVKALAMQGSEHGKVIIPGKSADSLVIQLVAQVTPGRVMPEKGDPLTAEQIGLLRAWIDQGAKWPDGLDPAGYVDRRNNWSFKPITHPNPPVVKNQKWVRNPIDDFILARLEREHLHPSPEADRVTLIRRLSLDLIGLPPTIAEVEDFVNDRSPNAYDKLVDRLLASPHYGEKWGRQWLDVARYADSNGYEKDLPRSIWLYRDWVINAFNQNMPFNEFTIEQMAGDLLPNATIEQKIATGFHRNTMINEEGGIDPEEFRVAAIMNRVEATGKTWLGLTVNCAQCHSHKYDPISQREYYQLFAFLNNDDEPYLDVPSKAQIARRKEILAKVAQIEADLPKHDPGFIARRAAWEKQLRDDSVDWTVLDPEAFYGSVGAKLVKLDDHSLLGGGSVPPVTEYTITTTPALTNITAFRLEALTHPSLPLNGPGRSSGGNFVLNSFTVDTVSPEGKTNRIVLENATADFSQNGFPIADAINPKTDNKHGWAIDAGALLTHQDRKAVFEAKEDLRIEPGTKLVFTLKQRYGSEHTIGRVRLSVTGREARPIKADILTTEARKIFDMPRDQRTPEQEEKLLAFYRTVDTNKTTVEASKEIDDLLKDWPNADTTLVLAQRAEPRQSHIFKRGDFRNPTELVNPGVPAFLPPLPKDAPLNRLTLAKWLVDPKNPLPARVEMNRIWQGFFGRGIVVTMEDFGTQGDKPSHPELLDWLASEFIERGWDVKAMQRLIVESATYRQSSKVTPASYEADQYNRLLSRGPRFRVEAEEIRDIALSASGLLSGKIGGPSVYPPIADGVLNLGYGTPMKWETSTGEDRYRRGMYIFWKRSVPYPSLSIFDAPTGEVTCPRRVVSDTPLQALTTLNDPTFEEAAQALAMRVWKEGGKTDRDRAVYAFELCTGHRPDETQLKDVLALVNDDENYFADRTTTAIQVASPDPKNPAPDVNLTKVAAWTLASRVLLNMDETLTKE